jgi:hypothetical protein
MEDDTSVSITREKQHKARTTSEIPRETTSPKKDPLPGRQKVTFKSKDTL